MWHEWNMNANDVMMMRLASYVNPSDVVLSTHDMHAHACAHCLSKIGTSKYSSGLACMQSDPNSAKLTVIICEQNAVFNL